MQIVPKCFTQFPTNEGVCLQLNNNNNLQKKNSKK